jgi:hypothetical protein
MAIAMKVAMAVIAAKNVHHLFSHMELEENTLLGQRISSLKS